MSYIKIEINIVSKEGIKHPCTIYLNSPSDFQFGSTVKELKERICEHIGLNKNSIDNLDIILGTYGNRRVEKDEYKLQKSDLYDSTYGHKRRDRPLFKDPSYSLHNVEIRTILTNEEVQKRINTYQEEFQKECSQFNIENAPFKYLSEKRKFFFEEIQKDVLPTYVIDSDYKIILLEGNNKEGKTLSIPTIKTKEILFAFSKEKIAFIISPFTDRELFQQLRSHVKLYTEVTPKYQNTLFKTPSQNLHFGFGDSSNLFVNKQPNLNNTDWEIQDILGAKSVLLLDPPLTTVKNAQNKKNIALVDVSSKDLEIKFPCIDNQKHDTTIYAQNFLKALGSEGFKKCTLNININEKNESGHYTASVIIPTKDVKTFMKNVCQMSGKDYEILYPPKKSNQQCGLQ